MPDSSTDCCPCRLEWRPSRWQAAAILLFWPLGAYAPAASALGRELPVGAMALLVLVAIAAGVVRARAHLRQPPGRLVLASGRIARWRSGARPVGTMIRGSHGGDAVDAEGVAVLHEQWPVTTVRLIACGTTIVFWPDTLSASGRRDLRRWARSATPASPLPQFWMG